MRGHGPLDTYVLSGYLRLIRGLTLLDLLDADVSGRDLPRGKPDPMIFLVAAEELPATPAPTRAGPGDPGRRKSCSAATRAGSSRGCPRRAESVNRTSPRAADGVDLRIRLEGVGRLAHALAGLQGPAERAAQRGDRGGQPRQAQLVGIPRFAGSRGLRRPGQPGGGARDQRA